MSSHWKEGKEIAVVGDKTVQDAFKGAGGRSNYKWVQYTTSGSCIGAAKGTENALKKK
jgi:hypothetical protein